MECSQARTTSGRVARRIGAGARGRPQGFGAPIGGGDAEPRIRIRKRPGDRSSASHGAGGDPRHRHGRPTPAYESPDIPVSCAQNRIICAHLLPRTARFSGARIGDLCGLQLADHKLFITARHRHLPAASREMNHRLSRQTRHQRPVAGRSRDPRSPAYAYLTRRLPRGTARGTAFRIVPAHRELSVLRAVSSVLLVRTVNGAPEAVAPEEPRAPHLVAVHGRGPAARPGPSHRLCLMIRRLTSSMT